AGGQVYILHGQDRRGDSAGAARSKKGHKLERGEVGFEEKALAVGNFIIDREGRTERALLSGDGMGNIMSRGVPGTRPFTDEEARARRLAAIQELSDLATPRKSANAALSKGKDNSEQWVLAESFSLPAQLQSLTSNRDSGQQVSLMGEHITGQSADD